MHVHTINKWRNQSDMTALWGLHVRFHGGSRNWTRNKTDEGEKLLPASARPEPALHKSVESEII